MKKMLHSIIQKINKIKYLVAGPGKASFPLTKIHHKILSSSS
jgi:hypothetical protein